MKGSSVNQILHNFSLQAGGSHYPTINPKMQQAFAEMIIRKCAEIAEQADSNPAQHIREYFGVSDGRTTNP